MDANPLPDHPNLEQYEKLAGDFINAYSSGDSEALRRIKDHYELEHALTCEELRQSAAQRLRSLGRLSDTEIPNARLGLAEAQLLVASSYGFESWQALAEHIEAMNQEDSAVWQFEAAVDAIITGDVSALDSLLREHPQLIRTRSTREHQATLLHYVGANGVEDFRQKTPKNAAKVAEILLEAGAEVDAMAEMYGGSTALGLVATSIHPLVAGVQIELLETLLKYGARIDDPGGSAVNGCLANGRGEAAEFLAGRGARLDLEGAAGVGRLDRVRSFFNEDGSLTANATKEQMKSGFAWACEFGRTSVVDFLLQNGIEVDAKLRHHGQTGLHWAACGGHFETVKLLLERNAPVDAKDENFGGTPLGWALYGWGEAAPGGSRAGYYDVVALLVAAGARVEREWLADPDRETQETPLAEKVRADPRMLAALGLLMP